MNELMSKKIDWELHRVRAARLELEIKVLEKQAELQKIIESIAAQKAREEELELQLKEQGN